MKKPKLKWTKKLPTVDGFYWWRLDRRDEPYKCRVIVEDGFAVGTEISGITTADWQGQWYGPIPSEEPN